MYHGNPETISSAHILSANFMSRVPRNVNYADLSLTSSINMLCFEIPRQWNSQKRQPRVKSTS